MLFWKWIEPIAAVAFLSSFIVYELLEKGFQVNNPRLLVPYALLVWSIFLYIMLVSGLVSYVYDSDKYLIVKNGKVKDRVMYSDIKEVEYFPRQAPRKVTLHLMQPSKFGKNISFSPYSPFDEFFSERNTVVETLIEKVEKSKLTV